MHEPKPLQDRKLYWVAKNRTRPDFVTKVGELLIPLSGHLESESEGLQAIKETLSATLCDEFYDFCWVGSFQGDCVVIYVSEPTLVSALQRQYLEPIQKILRENKNYKQVKRVIFKYGRSGISFRGSRLRSKQAYE